jgi:hypothetical protein
VAGLLKQGVLEQGDLVGRETVKVPQLLFVISLTSRLMLDS